ncbi:MAG TPA: PilZ domain-containing protein [Myxococcota bacterium]|nr:PilZ domain-containing protein [Myxococcota bacterium]
MDHKRAKRIKRRITCELVIDGKRQSGIVLDVSATGIFVQTAITSNVGQEVEVHLAATRTTPELTVRARVARGRRVPPQLLAAAGGGLGLRVIDAPPGFAQLIVGDDEAAPSPARSSPVVAAAPKSPKQRRFQVRLQATGSMRSRTVTVQCPDAKTAGADACAVVGGGWEVVDVSEQP